MAGCETLVILLLNHGVAVFLLGMISSSSFEGNNRSFHVGILKSRKRKIGSPRISRFTLSWKSESESTKRPRTESRDTLGRDLIIQRVWWDTRGGVLLVHESDKKELITYPARHSTPCRGIFVGWKRQREREKGGGASAVNCQIFILKGADRSASNIHRFLPMRPL